MEEQNTISYAKSFSKEKIDNTSKETSLLFNWQKKLLPFLIGLPTILILTFIVVTTRQINDFNSKLNENKTSEFIGTVIPSPSTLAYSNNIEYIKWVTLLHMEQESIDKRYKQAGFLLMSRVLTKYLGFLTGMILAIVGAAFIIGKLSEDKSTLEGSFNQQIKVNVASSSPGIIFGVLGTGLMLATILTHSEIDVQDQPLYLNPNTIQFIAPVKPQELNVHKIDPALLDSLDKVKK